MIGYNSNINKTILLSIILSTRLLAVDDLSIDDLLQDIEKKTDLSEKTKLENGGISYIFTRNDIEKMQAHNLKDILKSTYPFGYNENRFGLSDPYLVQASTPYMSSSIKVYIDNQEITTGLYGSGIILYGNMDIDFVDHIEIYSVNPTFEFSTEAAFTVIKLYSKVAKKDEGSKVAISGGSRGTKSITGYTTSHLENDWSYFAYASKVDDRREKYDNYGATLSRDSKTDHMFGSFSKGNHKILLDIISRSQDGFIGNSIFATPKDSTIDTDYIHIGYDTKYENISFLATFDSVNTKTYFEDIYSSNIAAINSTNGTSYAYLLDSDSNSEVYTASIKYNKNIGSNKLLVGSSYRLKHFNYDKIELNGEPLPNTGHDQQTTSTTFIENQHSIADNKIFTMGVSYSIVNNNHSNQDDNLLSYRLGYTYTNENIISKTIVSNVQIAIDPYLVNSIYLVDINKKIKPTNLDIYMEDLKYRLGSNLYEFIASYTTIQDQLIPNDAGLLDNYDKTLYIKSIFLRYVREYNNYSKFEFTIGYNNTANCTMDKKFFQYASTLRDLKTIGRFDIFNEILFYKDNYEYKGFYDYGAGVTYHKSDDLSFSIKGTNILNKARATEYKMLDPNTYTTDSSLHISSIDRKVMLTMEYTF